MRIVATDVQYDDAAGTARAAGVCFAGWADQGTLAERVIDLSGVAAYEPGRFYLRELPCLLALLPGFDAEVVVVDGYVDLGVDRPGLGRHLHAVVALPVVGVAKTAFHAAPSVPVFRGGSARPLFVTAAGMRVEEAAAAVARMAGSSRIPSLLKRVDQLARGLVTPPGTPPSSPLPRPGRT